MKVFYTVPVVSYTSLLIPTCHRVLMSIHDQTSILQTTSARSSRRIQYHFRPELEFLQRVLFMSHVLPWVWNSGNLSIHWFHSVMSKQQPNFIHLMWRSTDYSERLKDAWASHPIWRSQKKLIPFIPFMVGMRVEMLTDRWGFTFLYHTWLCHWKTWDHPVVWALNVHHSITEHILRGTAGDHLSDALQDFNRKIPIRSSLQKENAGSSWQRVDVWHLSGEATYPEMFTQTQPNLTCLHLTTPYH